MVESRDIHAEESRQKREWEEDLIQVRKYGLQDPSDPQFSI